MKVKVSTYSGYKADERPLSFIIRKREFRVEEIIDRWYGIDHDYFKVRADDGHVYVLRHDRQDGWELVMMERAGR